MLNLGDISKIGKNISSSSLKAVKALHVVAFGNEGEGRKTRKERRDFSGFHFDKKSSEFVQKVSKVKQKVQLPDLIAICSILDLDYSGSGEEVVVRICSFMNDLQSHGGNEKTDDKEVEKESEEEKDSDEDENGNDRGAKSSESFGKNEGLFSLTFKDVEDSRKKGITKWVILKIKLIAEFEVKVSSAQIDKLLMARKKRREESVKNNARIGSRANIETEVLIQYIIDGKQDDTSNKLVMYGAKTFGEFKEKVKLYELIKISRTQPGQERNKEGNHMKERTIETKKDKNENRHRKTSMRLCFNCGGKGHLSNECLDKAKGPKCFVMLICEPKVAKDYGLDMRKKKCQVLKTQIQLLGFIIDDGRVQPSNDETLANKNYPQPTTSKRIQSFLDVIFSVEKRNCIQTRANMAMMQKSNEYSRFHPVYYMSKKTTPAEEKIQ
ncbi:hypothetical protein JTB14_016750 [Gonioctena quinquepunctata]|nr:hypothetical protein JTB14_016750 [Gonioctena quinquepunctata]